LLFRRERFFGLESSPPAGLVDIVFDSFDMVPQPTAPPDAVDERTP
jgi:hypothetical protein